MAGSAPCIVSQPARWVPHHHFHITHHLVTRARCAMHVLHALHALLYSIWAGVAAVACHAPVAVGACLIAGTYIRIVSSMPCCVICFV
jgi:hypothetical protein